MLCKYRTALGERELVGQGRGRQPKVYADVWTVTACGTLAHAALTPLIDGTKARTVHRISVFAAGGTSEASRY